jgi:hypothetical protein
MKNIISRKVRSIFMLSGVAAMMGATLMVPRTAHADTAQNYKIGATALGVLGVVLAAKGKTAPALLAGAGAYYAYQKAQDAQQDEWYDNRYDRRYGNRYDDRYDNRYNDHYDRSSNYYQNDSNRYDSHRYSGDRYDDSHNNNWSGGHQDYHSYNGR